MLTRVVLAVAPGLHCGFTYPDFRGTGKRKRRVVSLSGTEETAANNKFNKCSTCSSVVGCVAPTNVRRKNVNFFFPLSTALSSLDYFSTLEEVVEEVWEQLELNPV